jgi:hypothetical protein
LLLAVFSLGSLKHSNSQLFYILSPVGFRIY